MAYYIRDNSVRLRRMRLQSFLTESMACGVRPGIASAYSWRLSIVWYSVTRCALYKASNNVTGWYPKCSVRNSKSAYSRFVLSTLDSLRNRRGDIAALCVVGRGENRSEARDWQEGTLLGFSFLPVSLYTSFQPSRRDDCTVSSLYCFYVIPFAHLSGSKLKPALGFSRSLNNIRASDCTYTQGTYSWSAYRH